LFNHPYMLELASHDAEYTITMRIIEEVDSNDIPDVREAYWILKTLEEGVELTNKAYPIGLPLKWLSWLDEICDKHGWDSQITHNNRVRYLPIYGGE